MCFCCCCFLKTVTRTDTFHIQFTYCRDFYSLMNFDCSNRPHLRVTFPSMKLLRIRQSRWDYVDHCPLIHCYLLLLLSFGNSCTLWMLLTFADQLVPSGMEMETKDRKKRRKKESFVSKAQIAQVEWNEMKWRKHQSTLISALFVALNFLFLS